LTFDFGASMQYNSGAFGPAAMFVNVMGATQLASEHLILTPTVSMQWEKETIIFTADSDTSMIEFIGDSNYTSDFIGLDNVGVVDVGTAPAPIPIQQPIPNDINSNTGNLIANGDFDNLGNAFVDNNGWSDDRLSPGGTDIPGWTNIAPPGAPPGYADEAWDEPVNGYGVSASPDNGSGYLVDLTGSTDWKPYGGIGQSIRTLPGRRYKLTFDFGASMRYNTGTLGPAAMTVNVVSSNLLASQHFILAPTTYMQWEKETVFFVADSNQTMIEFIGDSDYTSDFIGLDNVGVFAVGTK